MTLPSRARALALILLTACAAPACDSAPADGGDTTPTVEWIVGGLDFDGAQVTDRSHVPVARVALGADGWLVLWSASAGGSYVAPPIAAVFLTAGEHTDLVVDLDAPLDGDALHLSVHADDPADGRFTATSTDISSAKDRVMRTLAGVPVAATVALPNLPPLEPNAIAVADQTVTVRPPKVTATVVVDAFPKYLVIKDAAGAVLGSERVWQRGPAAYAVSVDLAPSWDPATLTAALFAADGNAPDLDAPVLDLAGAPVTATFEATRPPNNALTVTDQTLASWGYKINVAKVETEELPAWVAVYEDDGGEPGARLGAVAVSSSPKVALGVDLNRYVDPTETLWVALHADAPADGALTAADPYLRGADGLPLVVSILVTNAACDGLKTKYCDPARPHEIRWLDRCDAVSPVTTSCGPTGLCDDSGPYVACVTPPDPCAANVAKVCVPEDPQRVYWQNACGVVAKVAFPCGAAATCDDSSAGDARCAATPSCAGNATTACDASDPGKVFWRDACGALNGNSYPCGAASTCDDSDGAARCTTTASCAGNTRLVCNAADPTSLHWLDRCDAPSGSTVPCGAGLVCSEANGVAHCVDPNPCDGAAQKFCDPADLSVIKWLDGCGQVKASTIPCGSGYQCSAASGEPVCEAVDACGGNTGTVCVDGDPSHVYWVDGCGALTGSTYPCGVATCDDSSGEATCTLLASCEDTKLRVCDPSDPLAVRLTNACGDDLGVFKTCANGKRCVEAAAGAAECACVPTDRLRCFGTDFLYAPSGIVPVDSCGLVSGPAVTTCASGEVCYYEDQANAADPVCTTSLSDPSGPFGHRGCSFTSYLTYKTDLAVDCRCRRHPANPADFFAHDTSGNVPCMSQADSWALGWTLGDGPHYRHLLHNFNGGGVYVPASGEVMAATHFTDANYQGAGMVIAYDVVTGDRRIVSGRYPTPAGPYELHGSGYESQRAVGTQRFEATTLPGAWDLELGADGMLYVWGGRDGNREITRVHPTTGARTLVWRQALEGETSAPPFGQCYSTRPKSTWFGGMSPVQLHEHAFTMGPDGSFYLGFWNAAAEGNGVMRISADGASCTVVSRWNGTMGQVGGGAAPQYSSLEGFVIHAGRLYASLAVGSHLLAIDVATGSRTLIANPAGSPELTPGQSSMFWDATRELLITGGAVQSFSGVAIDLETGARQSLFRVGPEWMIQGPAPFDINAHGAIDNGNLMAYGALVMDPSDNDILYLVVKWGLVKYEISTGNSYVMSQ